MPVHNGWLPREGLTADPIFRAIGRTALNPLVLLPVLLAARLTRKGENLSILHATAFSRIKTLFYLSIARWLSSYYSRRVLNNGVADKYDWSREIVLITGGAGGIGGHMVRLFSEQGTTVVVLDIQPMTFEAAANVHYFKCDITSPSHLAQVASDIRAQVGQPTVLINNAGVARGKTVLGGSEGDVRRTFEVNALAHWWTAREFVPAMARADHGAVVTVASYAAFVTAPGMVDYCASKAAALSFHEGLAAELATRPGAPRVRSVVVAPGYARTPLFRGYDNGGHRFLLPDLEPESVAEAVFAKVRSGESGHVVLPAAGGPLISALRALPYWYQHKLRVSMRNLMANFQGRQVDGDLNKSQADEEKEAEGSTVLVSEQE